MSATEADISKWLDEAPEVKEPVGASESDIESFLDKPPETANIEETAKDEPWYQPAVEYGAGFNDQLLNLLDIPNDVYNWSAEKLGSDSRFPSTRELGKELMLGYGEGEEPDTGSYKAGEYTNLGLTFLAPILQLGKVAPLVANPTTTKGVLQSIAKPFVSSPKKALATELASSTAAGYGAHYGGEEWGPVGEQAGGLIMGLLPSLSTLPAHYVKNYALKSIFPFTEAGSKAKAGEIIRQLSESPNVAADIKRSSEQALKETRSTSAQLSRDPYLLALEEALVKDDPKLAHILREVDAENNAISKEAMRVLGGEGAIEDTIKSLGSTYTKLKYRLDLKVDKALQKAQTTIAKLSPSNQRKAANIEVRKQIEDSLSIARKDENTVWNKVDKTAVAPTSETKTAFHQMLLAREAEDDPADIPRYLYNFLGKLKDGALVGTKNSWKESRHVGGLQQLRSRLLQTVRAEKAGDTPNWNKVRILEDMEEAMLKDMQKSSAGAGLKDAIDFSRVLNQKFKGDIMSVILNNKRTGGSLAPELTLDSLGAGPKGAFYIKRILEASPESKPNVEDVLKMDILQQKIVKEDGLNIQKAKDYMLRNEQIMEMFPSLKENMDDAIGLAQIHKYFEGSAKVRLKKAEQALGYSLADKTQPGTFLTKIMKSKNPDQTMARVIRQVNSEGKAGIKADIVDMVLQKSHMSELGVDETFKLSGAKALGFWNENKKVLSKAFTKPELDRMDTILRTLRLGDKPKEIPVGVAKEALSPKDNILGFVVATAAARFGAKLGAGTSGASLRTSSLATKQANKFLGKLDVNAAKKLLKDAVQDKDLFIALSENVAKVQLNNKAISALQGWMLAHTVSSLEEKELNQ